MSKFFYITFKGMHKQEDQEQSLDLQFTQRSVDGYVILPLIGFIPDAIIDEIKKQTNLENVLLTSSIEMTKEEYLANISYKENKYKLDNATVDEMNSLISQTESGKLRVIVDPDCEKPIDDDPFSAGDFYKK